MLHPNTGEWTDSTGMVYLRARYYAPNMGRFTTRDTWNGNFKQPMSYNKWLYVYGNPVNLVDPTGKVPCSDLPEGPDREACEHNRSKPNPPNTENYNEKVTPPGISWLSNPVAEQIAQNLAPGLVKKVNAAQFQVPGHERYIVPQSDGTWKTYNVNFCGEVILAAVLHVHIWNITARQVVEKVGKGNKSGGTTSAEIAEFLNKYYGYYVSAKNMHLTGLGRELVRNVRKQLMFGHLIMTTVKILSGDSGVPYGGRVGVGGKGIEHWVLITGLSQQWGSPDESSWNWIRIFNPFDNETEYYWWSDFQKAWKASIAKKESVLIMPAPIRKYR